MFCQVCDKRFSGIENFKQHEVSERHKKKVLQQSSSTPNKSEHSVPLTSTPKTENVSLFFCPPCATNFHTLEDFTIHIQSVEHATMVLNKKKIQSNHLFSSLNPPVNLASDTLNSQENLNQDSSDSFTSSKDIGECDSSTQGNNINFLSSNSNVMSWQPRCEKCDKNFSGPEPYQQHIASFAHQKKCGMLAAPEVNPEMPSALTYSSFFCETCKVPCTGAEPYQQHMASARHQRKVALSNDGNNVLKDNSLASYNGNLKCEDCNKLCSGPLNYSQHLASEGHKKTVERNQIIKRLAGKENIAVGKDSEASAIKTEVDAVPVLAWYCAVCKIHCSGVEPYRQHMVSKSHGKKLILQQAESTQKLLQNCFSGNGSLLDDSAQVSKQELSAVDGKSTSYSTATGDLGQELKTSLYGDSLDLRTITPASLNVTFFDVNEPIDFDKNTKTEIEMSELDVGDDIDEEISNEMEE